MTLTPAHRYGCLRCKRERVNHRLRGHGRRFACCKSRLGAAQPERVKNRLFARVRGMIGSYQASIPCVTSGAQGEPGADDETFASQVVTM